MTIKQFIRIIIKTVQRLYSIGRPNEISKEIKKLAIKHNIDTKIAIEITKKIENNQQISWQTKHLFEKITTGSTQQIIQNIDKQILDIIYKNKDKTTPQEIKKKIKRLGIIKERYIDTVYNTTDMALKRASATEHQLQNNAKYFRYDGPATNIRKFCAEHLGKVYKISEIKQMSNGQGLNVLLFCGGWNCRHRWVPVLGHAEGNLFIHKTWEDKIAKATPQQKEKMNKQYTIAKKLSKFGKVELNYEKSQKTPTRHTTLLFEGKPTIVINNPKTLTTLNNTNAKTIIIQNTTQNQIQNAQKWLKQNPNKEIYLLRENLIKIIAEN